MTNAEIEALMAQRRYEEVYQALQPRKDDPLLSIVLGQAAAGTGRYAEELAFFAIANKSLPNFETAAMRYAQALLAHGKRNEARRHFDDALRRFPNSPHLLYLKIRLDIDERGVNGARPEIANLASLAPNSVEARQFVDALAIIDGAQAMLKNYGSPHANARWEDFLFAARHKDARFFGTNAAQLSDALKRAPAEGLTLEFGVFHGHSLGAIAEQTPGQVDGFDSFQGLPEAWVSGEPAGHYTTHGKLPAVAHNVHLHPGWFADTVPPFMAATKAPVRFAHIDCDLYSSTKTVLDAIRPNLAPGSVLVFDDFLGFKGARDHEFKAWTEFVAANTITFDYVSFVLLDRAAAVVIR